ncbi:MAG: heat-shock protein Hsp90 [Alcanivorax borkumensis]|uniref:Chaperone protein HtpG n=1 Tax=Alcanivorax borkumensis (strain ATCC 700651 / DSM 11573 / NCIMB 13689 / SK2) TaxID=393595 RepID=HTPG_ALCBS|nr:MULTISPECIES: molecular chaperone HtpG [Alcanivorax]Q0VPG1.1 RecName: Full=Chaperone protein HtpG; AltName: Full=Heat shock protein HtpG; AltName: Full=High temperature protein G [Alcanivorax borkumensis SK2]OJH09048.1 MAG: heat-shock protein Hsp90 [Alcanivorax borkumensis]BAP14391.1 heat shock protein 90 [Alcanivorax sp. NBRC 101098]CAL16937.1 heat shock protein HtpG [Alcanivorax borkumensis SK2]
MSAEKQTHGFQAEVSRLLHLMIHSLYSNREIFLRELISNASDACDKLRFEALDNPALLEQGGEPQITLRVDKDAGTLTIADNGIGMSENEVVDNLGTIARSGTEKFLANLSGDQKKDAQLIGQFGVGFYSAFIVAETVTVETRKAGEAVNNGVRWESDGKGEFTVETVPRDEQGTAVILHLRDDAKDFLDDFKIRQVIGQYSDHVAFPIVLETPQEGDKDTKTETLNSATALWQRPRSEVTDEEYQSFYKHISHDFQDALTWSHNKVEGKLEYTSLLYVPAQAPFDLYQREANRGLKLYVQRVFIMDDAEQFLPQYLRFIKGVIDAPDLPLNVSRELLQDYGPVQKIRSALTKRVLQMLKKLSNDDKQYAKFWAQFGSVIKEGVAEDRDNQQSIAALLRFATSKTPDSVSTSLDQYLESKPADQDCIYYLLADTPSAARQSPHLEVFRKKGIEVLLLSDPVDEWMVGYLESYKEVKLVNAARGELDLGDESEQANNDDPLIQRLAASLTEQVEAVRATTRLVDSPACLVLAEDQLGPQMRRMLEAAGQPVPENKPVLEVNLDHTLLQALTRIEEDEKFNDFAALLLDQAMLAEGQLPKDPAATARRMQALLSQSV